MTEAGDMLEVDRLGGQVEYLSKMLDLERKTSGNRLDIIDDLERRLEKVRRIVSDCEYQSELMDPDIAEEIQGVLHGEY